MKELNRPPIVRAIEDCDAQYINAEHEAGKRCDQERLEHYLNAGRRWNQKRLALTGGKRQGGLTDWVKANVRCTQQTLNRYGRFADLVDSVQNSENRFPSYDRLKELWASTRSGSLAELEQSDTDTTEPKLEELAERIDVSAKRAEEWMVKAVADARRQGQELVKARGVHDGPEDWLKWCQDNLEMGRREVQQYIDFAKYPELEHLPVNRQYEILQAIQNPRQLPGKPNPPVDIYEAEERLEALLSDRNLWVARYRVKVEEGDEVDKEDEDCCPHGGQRIMALLLDRRLWDFTGWDSFELFCRLNDRFLEVLRE
jgi:hypothetical protein